MANQNLNLNHIKMVNMPKVKNNAEGSQAKKIINLK